MASQALLPPEPPLELQQDVQRKLGRCLLRLQQYEILLKALVAHSEISGPAEALQDIRDAQVSSTQKKTLGTLVGMLTERSLALPGTPETEEDSAQDINSIWCSFRFRLELDEQRYQTTIGALKELVDLRNELVHHFLQRFNIWELQACADANAYLDASYETIDGHYLTLRSWAKAMEEARVHVAAFMRTSTFEDLLVNGIAPDGTIDWPASGAVRCLREAESHLKTAQGWTHLNSAIAWMQAHHAEQRPSRYGCGSWRQVMHESQQFEVRRDSNLELGRSEVWYRSRAA